MPSTNTPHRPRIQLSATQLIASALAAVTATIAASYLGVSGTVIGAALASVLTVAGNAVYGHSIHRTSERVRTAVPISGRWLPPAERHGLEPAPTAVLPARPARRPHSPLPRRLAIASVAVFAAVLALVTSVELVAGRPLSDLLRGRSGQGTTVFGPAHQARSVPQQPSPATVTQTVTPHVVVTTPTVTQTAPPVTATTTPTPPTPSPSPSTSVSGSPTSVPTP
ncbi:MAG TPA: hypothetical protein VIO13_13475 [Candidatus Dormibacteraeota bacterium]